MPEETPGTEIPTMPEEKKATSTEEIPMLDSSGPSGEVQTDAPPMIENLSTMGGDSEDAAADVSDGADVETGTEEVELTDEEKERQESELEIINWASWRMHQCVKASCAILRDELKDNAGLLNMSGPDGDIDQLIKAQPHTYIMANEIFRATTKELHYLDYEAEPETESDDAPSGDEGEE